MRINNQKVLGEQGKGEVKSYKEVGRFKERVIKVPHGAEKSNKTRTDKAALDLTKRTLSKEFQ